jgi:protein-arginine kinase activator protein McsA
VPQCKACGEEADELVSVKVNGKTKRLCESCADQENADEAIKQESEAVVQNMMGFKGRR